MRKLLLSFVAVAALSISMVQLAEAVAVHPAAPVPVATGSKVIVRGFSSAAPVELSSLPFTPIIR